jgi:hypothetical protein
MPNTRASVSTSNSSSENAVAVVTAYWRLYWPGAPTVTGDAGVTGTTAPSNVKMQVGDASVVGMLTAIRSFCAMRVPM